MNRGFFSIYIAGFAVILLISILYAQSVRDESQSRIDQLLVMQQELSKDWFMARNAYENFSADAMMHQIETSASPPAPPGCVMNPTTDYAGEISTYWSEVYDKLKSHGIDCKAELSATVQNTFEGTNLSAPFVQSNTRGYGLLTCVRSSGGIDLNLTRPFVIKKRVDSVLSGTFCQVSIWDTLGAIPPVTEIKVDVARTFP